MTNTHLECDIDGGCGSSDAMTVNPDGSRKCYSCGKFAPSGGSRPTLSMTKKPKEFQVLRDNPVAIPDRGLNVATTTKYGIVTRGDETFFPYHDASGKLVAYKVRRKDKTMYSSGDIKSATLFGQHLFPKGSAKSITIVEGEFDAPSSFDIQGSKYPVVSIKNGASGALKDCKENFEYLNSFDTIVVNFDSDEPGQAAAKEVCELFSDKAKNLKLAEAKDANDYLVSGGRDRYRQEWWNAEEYTPDGIVNGKDMYDLLMEPIQMPYASYPWDGMTLMSYGIRRGEIVTLLAGSGVGKTTITKEILNEIFDGTNEPIGILSLEEGLAQAGLSMLSLKANKRFHLPTKSQMEQMLKDPARVREKPFLDDVTEEERLAQKKAAYPKVYETGRFHFLDHKGSLTVESVLGQLRYLAKAKGCKTIVLDHISILVGMTSQNRKVSEREAIDEAMHSLRSLVEETDITIFNVCHLRKPAEGVGHDEGRQVRAVEARGSGAIIQLSDIGWALEGNRQADDPLERNTTIIRGLKMRIGGGGGIACHLRYDEATGRLNEFVPEPEVADEEVL